MIIAYRKYITEAVTRELRLPESADQSALGVELTTVDGITYVSLPDGVGLPDNQPPEIADSIAEVVLTADLRAAISAASPHVQLINERVSARIAKAYSIGDEIKLLRTPPSTAILDVGVIYLEFRAGGRAQKAALGL